MFTLVKSLPNGVLKMKLDDVIELPLYFQVALGCGFVAYMIAMHGRRKDEKAMDLFFGVIAFSLPSMLPWFASEKIGAPAWIGICSAITFSLCLGIIWRKWGKKLFYKVMHEAEISTDSGYKSTWQRIIQDVDIIPMQVFVTLKDGKILSCEQLGDFYDAAIPRWNIDDEGNVAIYVTHIDGKEENATSLRVEEWGDLITYIPSSEIYTVAFRCLKKSMKQG